MKENDIMMNQNAEFLFTIALFMTGIMAAVLLLVMLIFRILGEYILKGVYRVSMNYLRWYQDYRIQKCKRV